MEEDSVEESSVAGEELPGERPLSADAGVTFRRLREVIDLLRAAGVDEVELLTTQIPARSED